MASLGPWGRTAHEKARDDRALRKQFARATEAVSAWLADGHDVGTILSIEMSFSTVPVAATIHVESPEAVRRLCRTVKVRDDRVTGSPKPHLVLLAFEKSPTAAVP